MWKLGSKLCRIEVVTTSLKSCGHQDVARVPHQGELIAVNDKLCRVREVIFNRQQPGAVEVVVSPVRPLIERCYENTDALVKYVKGGDTTTDSLFKYMNG